MKSFTNNDKQKQIFFFFLNIRLARIFFFFFLVEVRAFSSGGVNLEDN